jgi:hypothetical protein
MSYAFLRLGHEIEKDVKFVVAYFNVMYYHLPGPGQDSTQDP